MAGSGMESGQARVIAKEKNNRRVPSSLSQKTPRKAGIQSAIKSNPKRPAGKM